MEGVRHADVVQLLGLIADAAAEQGPDPFPRDLLLRLETLLGADLCLYGEGPVSGSTRLTVTQSRDVPPESRAVVEAIIRHQRDNPLGDRRCAHETRARKMSDVMSLSDFRRTALYAESWRPRGIEYRLTVWLTSPPGQTRRIIVDRSAGRDFGERERTLLELLRPHLMVFRENAQARRVAAERPELELTPREAEILRWVAQGKRNAEVAQLLWLSPHTVRKHLENVYEKLGVSTRTEAVARAFG